MAGWQLLLEIALMALLGATLFHALRLERALGVVRRDRAELDALLRGFNESTRAAENGVERLRSAADGAGRHIARQIEAAANLKDDLMTLIERGERLADRLDGQVRSARDVEPPPRRYPVAEALAPEPAGSARVRSQAERDLLRALRVTR